jgi:hypothetical protein
VEDVGYPPTFPYILCALMYDNVRGYPTYCLNVGTISASIVEMSLLIGPIRIHIHANVSATSEASSLEIMARICAIRCAHFTPSVYAKRIQAIAPKGNAMPRVRAMLF